MVCCVWIVVKSRALAVNPGFENPTLEISPDTRIRVYCIIGENDSMFEADVLLDSGDSEELCLPARKILQLQLKRTGSYNSKSSHNTQIAHYKFKPVLVKMIFDREGVQEEYSEYLAVHCLAEEYEEELMQGSTDFSLEESAVPHNASAREVIPASVSAADASCGSEIYASAREDIPVSVSAANASYESPTAAVRKYIFSPVSHGPARNRSQRVALGNRGLQKLGLILNCANGEVWHEELYYNE
jgi:hypothetical protein